MNNNEIPKSVEINQIEFRSKLRSRFCEPVLSIMRFAVNDLAVKLESSPDREHLKYSVRQEELIAQWHVLNKLIRFDVEEEGERRIIMEHPLLELAHNYLDLPDAEKDNWLRKISSIIQEPLERKVYIGKGS